jgi:hypothetical protein
MINVSKTRYILLSVSNSVSSSGCCRSFLPVWWLSEAAIPTPSTAYAVSTRVVQPQSTVATTNMITSAGHSMFLSCKFQEINIQCGNWKKAHTILMTCVEWVKFVPVNCVQCFIDFSILIPSTRYISVRYYEINMIKYIDIQNTNWFLLILPSLFHLNRYMYMRCIIMKSIR